MKISTKRMLEIRVCFAIWLTTVAENNKKGKFQKFCCIVLCRYYLPMEQMQISQTANKFTSICQAKLLKKSVKMTVFAGKYKFLRNLKENNTTVEKLFWIVQDPDGNL